MRAIASFLIGTACLLAQPAVRDVRSAAGDLNPGLPGYGIAAGSLISIAGTITGDPQTAAFPLTASLSGVSVKIAVGGQELDALMVSVAANRILALVPSQTPAGAGKARVTDSTGTTELDITIMDRNFGIFTQKGSASGVGAAYAWNISDSGSTANGLTTPVMPGQQIAILGSGAGATTQDETNAVMPESLSGDFQLFIGGQVASIVSTGRSGLGLDALGLPAGLAGIDSIVAVVPAGLSGCRVAIVAITDSARVSNFGTISISADGSTCSDPGYLSSDDINNLPTSGSYNVGSISLTRFSTSLGATPIGNIQLNSDSASASFSRLDAGDFRATGGGNFTSLGSCIVTIPTNEGSGVGTIALPTPLDAGAQINLAGPKGTTILNRQADGSYASAIASGANIPGYPGQGTPFVDPGTFTADNGSGGADVQSFTASLVNPAAITWTNQAALTSIDRAAGVTVTWTGGTSDGTVYILGSSVAKNKISASFVCTAPASAGSFQVPSAVTLALPPSDGAVGALSVNSTVYSRFTAPGVDQGIFTSSSGGLKTLAYK